MLVLDDRGEVVAEHCVLDGFDLTAHLAKELAFEKCQFGSDFISHLRQLSC